LKTHFLLPDPNQVRLDGIDVEDQTLHLTVSPTSLYSICPVCSQESVRIHSRYTRQPADLPCSGFSVQLHLNIRRFFCDNPACPHRTFTERLPNIVAPFARRTKRLVEAQRAIGFSDGGEAGARLSAKLGMSTSPDTLLRMINSTPEFEAPCPRVLGVDDWAIRKRHTYGTILVDLERQQVVDLLPDRKPETLANWLSEHPGIEIISRDRGQEFIDGIALGAPQVIQVADRFHLLQNLLEVVERLFKHMPNELRQAAEWCSHAGKEDAERGHPGLVQEGDGDASAFPGSEKPEKTYRQMRFEEVKELQAQGCNRREIARRLGIDRRTVAKYFHLQAPPRRSLQNGSGSKALPYLDYLQKRWEEGCHNLKELLSELQGRGFTGSYASLYRAVHGRLGVGNLKTAKAPASKPIVFSPRQAAWVGLRPEESLREQQKAFRQALSEVSDVASQACLLAQSFREMIENRQSEKLDEWLQQAENSEIEEFERFSDSLRTDYSAVKAALTYSWSNGQVEGQVTRLKLIKRQMYGRANFGLLRKRVLPSTGSP
jgi:transposase